MYIGEISKLTGASPKAIRLYETLGLLGRIGRSGSYRVYSDSEVGQIRLIRQAQALGFRLSELRPLLGESSDEPDWEGLVRQIDRKRAEIRQEIQRLRKLDVHLRRINEEIRSCLDGEADGHACDTSFAGTSDKRA